MESRMRKSHIEVNRNENVLIVTGWFQKDRMPKSITTVRIVF